MMIFGVCFVLYLIKLSAGNECCSMLLTTMSNMGSTTLISTVIINREQVVRFLLCILSKRG